MKLHKKERLDYLDMVKGLGIILVVIGHSTYAGENLLTWIASFHMPLFFIISGMLLQFNREEENDIGKTVKKKLRTILLPYFSFSVIYLIMDGMMLFLHLGSKVWVDFVYEFLGTITLYGISTLWFLPALFLGEISFLYIRKKRNHFLTIGVGIALALVVGLTHPLFDSTYPLFNAIYYLLPGYFLIFLYRSAVAYVFIMMGYYTQLFIKENIGIQIREIFLGVALLVAGMAFAFANGRVDLHSVIFHNNIYFYISAFAGTMGTVFLCRNIRYCGKQRLLKPVLAAGRNSLIIMVTHLEFRVMITAIRGAGLVSTRMPGLMPYIQWILVAVLVILMEWVIVVVMNRYFYFLIGKRKPLNRKKFTVVK
ncbi:MAG: acyltransferase [Lachnospiraceae bacterium]|nr:acyltransferase [Lachnospiraceae bacterium]